MEQTQSEGSWRELQPGPNVIDLTINESEFQPGIRLHTQSTQNADIVVLSDDDDAVDDGGVGPSTATRRVNGRTQRSSVIDDDDDDEVQFVRETAPRPSAGSSSSSPSSSSTRRSNLSLLGATIRGIMARRDRASRGPRRRSSRSPSTTRWIVEMLAGSIERSGEQQRRLLQQQGEILREIQDRRELLNMRRQHHGGWMEANSPEGYHVRYNTNNGRRVFEPNVNNNAHQNPFYRNAPLWTDIMTTAYPVSHPAYAFFPDLDYHLPPPESSPAPAQVNSNLNPTASGQTHNRTSKIVSARPGYTKTLDSEPILACPKCLREFDSDKADGKELKVSMIVGCGHVICNDCAEAMFLAKKPLKKARVPSKKGKQKATSATALGKRRRSQDVQHDSKADIALVESLLSDEDKDFEWIKRATGLCPACNRRVKPKAVIQLYI
ncbi:hypothetical protein BGW41_003724 [Actinomortierella wolfii]|nr:hypothetical protein BGW41_003724 [Actinomortierella wolfii]